MPETQQPLQPFTISLRIVLTSMVLLVAIVATVVSFVPLYVASMDSATLSAEEFSEIIAVEIAEKIEKTLSTLQNAATVMTSAAKLGAWSPDDVPSIRKWMNYGVGLGADSVNMIFDDNITWTAGHVKPDTTVVNLTELVLIKYNTTFGEMYIVNATDLTTISGPTFFPGDPNFKSKPFYPSIRANQSWGILATLLASQRRCCRAVRLLYFRTERPLERFM